MSVNSQIFENLTQHRAKEESKMKIIDEVNGALAAISLIKRQSLIKKKKT
jgi:hypothetical protein